MQQVELFLGLVNPFTCPMLLQKCIYLAQKTRSELSRRTALLESFKLVSSLLNSFMQRSRYWNCETLKASQY